MAIDTTVGGKNAQSYATVDDFKTYRTYRLPANTAVTAATDPVIEAALVVGARFLDQDFTWTGTAVDPASDDATEHQSMCWPRNGMLTRNGFSIAGTALPRELKDAQCEIAFLLISGVDLVSDDAAMAAGLTSVRAGSVSLSFQREQLSTKEGLDSFMRRFNSEFNYLSRQVTSEVRRILVPSWFEQPSIVRPVLFAATGGCR